MSISQAYDRSVSIRQASTTVTPFPQLGFWAFFQIDSPASTAEGGVGNALEVGYRTYRHRRDVQQPRRRRRSEKAVRASGPDRGEVFINEQASNNGITTKPDDARQSV